MTTCQITCHACGREFEVTAGFIGGIPQDPATGRLLSTCNLDADTSKHHAPEVIRASWLQRFGGAT